MEGYRASFDFILPQLAELRGGWSSGIRQTSIGLILCNAESSLFSTSWLMTFVPEHTGDGERKYYKKSAFSSSN